jgi:hypothetical protein
LAANPWQALEQNRKRSNFVLPGQSIAFAFMSLRLPLTMGPTLEWIEDWIARWFKIRHVACHHDEAVFECGGRNCKIKLFVPKLLAGRRSIPRRRGRLNLLRDLSHHRGRPDAWNRPFQRRPGRHGASDRRGALDGARGDRRDLYRMQRSVLTLAAVATIGLLLFFFAMPSWFEDVDPCVADIP